MEVDPPWVVKEMTLSCTDTPLLAVISTAMMRPPAEGDSSNALSSISSPGAYAAVIAEALMVTARVSPRNRMPLSGVATPPATVNRFTLPVVPIRDLCAPSRTHRFALQTT